jgi:hypothetical protein
MNKNRVEAYWLEMNRETTFTAVEKYQNDGS